MKCIGHDGKTYLLQKCPFCGNDFSCIWSEKDRATENGEEFCGVDKFTVVCDFFDNGCGATCGWHDTVADAVGRWNTRVVI